MIKTLEKKPDMALISLLIILIVFGLVMLSSASVVLGQTKFSDPYIFLKKQILLGVIPGIIFFYGCYLFDFKFWQKLALPLLIFSLTLMLMVFLPFIGIEHAGARRWIGIGSFSFQPSELLKLAFIIYLASWLKNKRSANRSLTLPFLSLLGAISLLIILQPDIGTLIVIIASSLAMYFAAGAPIKDMAKIAAVSLILFTAVTIFSPYRLNRIKTFFNRARDPLGISYQINQSILAIGSGGILGLGLGHSRQKFNYLPEVNADAIFAIIAEELGFIFSTILIGLFLAIGIKGIDIARKTENFFGKLVATGIAAWLLSQTLINISATAGILPFTGVPLPFISYGGTAMLFLLSGMGILANISRYASESRTQA